MRKALAVITEALEIPGSAGSATMRPPATTDADAGGWAVWREVYRSPGQAISLPPEVRAALEPILRPPPWLASSEARRPWGNRSPHLEINDHTRSTMVRKRFKAKRKVPRPRHTTNP
jgi:hypothetical protein